MSTVLAPLPSTENASSSPVIESPKRPGAIHTLLIENKKLFAAIDLHWREFPSDAASTDKSSEKRTRALVEVANEQGWNTTISWLTSDLRNEIYLMMVERNMGDDLIDKLRPPLPETEKKEIKKPSRFVQALSAFTTPHV